MSHLGVYSAAFQCSPTTHLRDGEMTSQHWGAPTLGSALG